MHSFLQSALTENNWLSRYISYSAYSLLKRRLIDKKESVVKKRIPYSIKTQVCRYNRVGQHLEHFTRH